MIEIPAQKGSAPFRLCLVTDASRVHAPLAQMVRRAALGGLDAVQVREKRLSAKALYELSLEVRDALAEGVVLINDRADVALSIPGAGLHLPGGGIGVTDARALLGPERLIGRSTHSLDEAIEAGRAGADYVIFGPVFDTPSKRGFGEPQGLEKLKAACRSCTVPVIAIGGIVPERAAKVRDAGAAGMAVMSYLLEAGDPGDAAAKLVAAWER